MAVKCVHKISLHELMEATKVDQVKENSDLKPTSMLATGVSQVKTSQTRPVERSEYGGKEE